MDVVCVNDRWAQAHLSLIHDLHAKTNLELHHHGHHDCRDLHENLCGREKWKTPLSEQQWASFCPFCFSQSPIVQHDLR